MLELAILGFLYERPMHGYELKQSLNLLTGHVRPVSDGALYPAISRLEKSGFLVKKLEAGKAAAPRQTLTITNIGKAELLRRLSEPSDLDISDRNRFFTVLSFLRFAKLEDQRRVLERRLQFLNAGVSFFQADGKPVKLEEEQDPYRRGMLLIAKETKKVERQWLKETLESMDFQG
ncbi:PadR family transcriptional regulator [Paenibacillus thermotolerans]|uniref:PadR family transcriptional regulator n=1 Tax=Paenibacillus thermotolerans TaxID=3027807 RepID=UPI002367D49F|nr:MULTISPECIES: PadR family transcriptional regulator [unclassified Paenibacillus]